MFSDDGFGLSRRFDTLLAFGILTSCCVAFGYPVGAVGKNPKPKDKERRDLVTRAKGPLLLVRGTRDRISDFETVSGVIQASNRTHAMHSVETGDHSLIVTKAWCKANGGVNQTVVDDRIAEAVASFITENSEKRP